jgi:hypothetical protein
MPLTWNVRKIKNYEEVTTDPDNPKKWHPLTEAFVWYSYVIGMHEITEKNYEEFFTRIFIEERTIGTIRLRPQEGAEPLPVYTTLEEVKSHIGMHTNVSKKTLTQFWKGIKRDVVKHGGFPAMKADLSWVLIQKQGKRMIELFKEYGANDLALAVERLLSDKHAEDDADGTEIK